MGEKHQAVLIAATSAIFLFAVVGIGEANPEAKRLYDDLLSSYNRYIVFKPSGLTTSQRAILCDMELLFQTDQTSRKQLRSPYG